MKRGTPDHPKTKDLIALMGCSKAEAVGILELLWHFTAEFCADGDLSKWTPRQLANSLSWEGDPEKLVQALCESRLLDVLPACARYVHDWHEHADNAVQMKLARAGAYFGNGYIPNINRLTGKERISAIARYQLECDLEDSNSVSTAVARYNEAVRTTLHGVRTPGALRAARQSPAPPEPRQSPAPPEASEESAEVQQQPDEPQPTPARLPDELKNFTNSKNPSADVGIAGASRQPVELPPDPLDCVRQALAEATGKPSASSDPLPRELAYRAAVLGAHPAILARWIWQVGKSRKPESHGFYPSVFDAEFQAWIGRFGGQVPRVVSRTTCRCGAGEDIAFADCVIGHPCKPRAGLQKLSAAVGPKPVGVA